MKCPRCGVALQQVGRFWICPEHGPVSVQDHATNGMYHRCLVSPNYLSGKVPLALPVLSATGSASALPLPERPGESDGNRWATGL